MTERFAVKVPGYQAPGDKVRRWDWLSNARGWERTQEKGDRHLFKTRKEAHQAAGCFDDARIVLIRKIPDLRKSALPICELRICHIGDAQALAEQVLNYIAPGPFGCKRSLRGDGSPKTYKVWIEVKP